MKYMEESLLLQKGEKTNCFGRNIQKNFAHIAIYKTQKNIESH
jgi:hypothetical protein